MNDHICEQEGKNKDAFVEEVADRVLARLQIGWNKAFQDIREECIRRSLETQP